MKGRSKAACLSAETLSRNPTKTRASRRAWPPKRARAPPAAQAQPKQQHMQPQVTNTTIHTPNAIHAAASSASAGQNVAINEGKRENNICEKAAQQKLRLARFMLPGLLGPSKALRIHLLTSSSSLHCWWLDCSMYSIGSRFPFAIFVCCCLLAVKTFTDPSILPLFRTPNIQDSCLFPRHF